MCLQPCNGNFRPDVYAATDGITFQSISGHGEPPTIYRQFPGSQVDSYCTVSKLIDFAFTAVHAVVFQNTEIRSLKKLIHPYQIPVTCPRCSSGRPEFGNRVHGEIARRNGVHGEIERRNGAQGEIERRNGEHGLQDSMLYMDFSP